VINQKTIVKPIILNAQTEVINQPLKSPVENIKVLQKETEIKKEIISTEDAFDIF